MMDGVWVEQQELEHKVPESTLNSDTHTTHLCFNDHQATAARWPREQLRLDIGSRPGWTPNHRADRTVR
ncbi:unnamed protein product [Pleuronectes platessa]|uniref:Uncharacterized protein n=1 Tax=Pleuronectes platessa TaxID=8262 RepID=A0A9N7U302_PLEPL|nr:unnamed protein product [Pleuronectes platessa]